MKTCAAAFAASLLVLTPFAAVATAGPQRDADVRFATFNASLNRNFAGQLVADLSTPANAQAATVAEIVQRARPDVLLVNEFDFDAGSALAPAVPGQLPVAAHNGARPDRLPIPLLAPSNTGIPSGFDLNNNGSVAAADDAFGFGFFPGQFGMAVYSLYPIDRAASARSRTSSGRTCPGALLPDDPHAAPADWYSTARAERLPALVQEPLGPADPDRRERRCTSSSAIRRRPSSTARGPERQAQPRRDPLLGRLLTPGQKRATSTTTPGAGRPQARRLFVIAGD